MPLAIIIWSAIEDLPSRSIDIISNANMGIGCESHHTIKEVKGRLNFLSEKGIYSVAPDTPVLEASALIAPLFDSEKYNFRQAVSGNWNENDLYFTVLPTKDSSVSSTLIIAMALRRPVSALQNSASQSL